MPNNLSRLIPEYDVHATMQNIISYLSGIQFDISQQSEPDTAARCRKTYELIESLRVVKERITKEEAGFGLPEVQDIVRTGFAHIRARLRSAHHIGRQPHIIAPSSQQYAPSAHVHAHSSQYPCAGCAPFGDIYNPYVPTAQRMVSAIAPTCAHSSANADNRFPPPAEPPMANCHSNGYNGAQYSQVVSPYQLPPSVPAHQHSARGQHHMSQGAIAPYSLPSSGFPEAQPGAVDQRSLDKVYYTQAQPHNSAELYPHSYTQSGQEYPTAHWHQSGTSMAHAPGTMPPPSDVHVPPSASTQGTLYSQAPGSHLAPYGGAKPVESPVALAEFLIDVILNAVKFIIAYGSA
ncbi:hypothetical protein EW146_g4003 [Bondarzewia mesenterica]|uniref:Uncharacterized protein n=1 Tax=Bondarzewia mesenterica TaxID=1095465 RepID=A0A4S4LVV2_9AGAM|nr:hypothetical protein EW146_g4003 [Bondarzewia mesenterica]